MHHPITIAFGAASTTVLAAAMRAGNAPLFFLAFAVLCFVLAALVQTEDLPDSARPLFWVVPGALLMAGSACMLRSHSATGAAATMVLLGAVYFTLGMVNWLRARYS